MAHAWGPLLLCVTLLCTGPPPSAHAFLGRWAVDQAVTYLAGEGDCWAWHGGAGGTGTGAPKSVGGEGVPIAGWGAGVAGVPPAVVG